MATLLCPKDSGSGKSVIVTNGAQRWVVTATSVHEAPAKQKDIAMEAEPSIDLMMNRID